MYVYEDFFIIVVLFKNSPFIFIKANWQKHDKLKNDKVTDNFIQEKKRIDIRLIRYRLLKRK